MAASELDGQDSTDIFSGDPRLWASLSDLVIVKEMSVLTVPDEQMAFTPGGITSKPIEGGKYPEGFDGIRAIFRNNRATLNLDKAYVTQSFRDPTQPKEFSRAEEYNARSLDSDDPGMNPSEMGAIGKMTDVFRVSTAKNFPDVESPIILPPMSEPKLSELDFSYNDFLGTFPGRKDQIFGRLEIRCPAHFYMSDRRTGPIGFTKDKWPRDEDSAGDTAFPGGLARDIVVDYTIVEATKVVDPAYVPPPPVIGEDPPEPDTIPIMAGEILTGYLAFSPDYHAWCVVATLPRRNTCNIPSLFLTEKTLEEFSPEPEFEGPPEEDPPGPPPEPPPEPPPGSPPAPEPDPVISIDERIEIFSIPKCPDIDDEGFATPCIISPLTDFISCEEVSTLKYNERWAMIVDRFNSLISEVDRLWCAVFALDIKTERLVSATFAHLKNFDDLVIFITDEIVPKIGLKHVLEETMKYVDSIAASVKAMPDYGTPAIVPPDYHPVEVPVGTLTAILLESITTAADYEMMPEICEDIPPEVEVSPPPPP